MSVSLKDYRAVIGDADFNEIQILADRLKGRTVKMVNSTAVGGGVAEILARAIPLYKELGLAVTWEVIQGTEDFFGVTKAFHNALHGAAAGISPRMFQIFEAQVEQMVKAIKPDADFMVIHDPQPAGLIQLKKESASKWIWRCHIDTSHPDESVWDFLKKYVTRYDATVFSMPSFTRRLPLPQFWIPPAIDPLSDKNKPLDAGFIRKTLDKYGISPKRPLVTQISRFDRLKDPVGVIKAYQMAKRSVDCQLVLAGGGASDDPEGSAVLAEVQEAAQGDPDIHIMVLPPFSDLEINALQRASAVVLQKSLREGFGLTVTEALWKGTPVIAGAVGGIPLQVRQNLTGLLVHSVEGAAHAIRYLLSNPDVAKRFGEKGREYVKERFLLTRNIRNYLLMMIALEHPGQTVIQP